jgi:hypothetical protein
MYIHETEFDSYRTNDEAVDVDWILGQCRNHGVYYKVIAILPCKYRLLSARTYHKTKKSLQSYQTNSEFR